MTFQAEESYAAMSLMDTGDENDKVNQKQQKIVRFAKFFHPLRESFINVTTIA
jgi:hypothetical protein